VLEELFRGWAFAPSEAGLPRDLDAIGQSTLVIHGARDRIIHPDTARKVVGQLPRARLELLDGIGHVPQLEAPGRVARLIARHLEEQP
jgi:pimeloyl-ACP methyl ester carboxylesterase